MRNTLCCSLLLVSVSFCADQNAGNSVSTRTGWFGDASCTRERVQAGNVSPNNPECAKKCVKDGSPLGFVDEQAKTFTVVSNPDRVLDDIGYRVQVSARASGNKLEVISVRHLSTINAMCERKPLKTQ